MLSRGTCFCHSIRECFVGCTSCFKFGIRITKSHLKLLPEVSAKVIKLNRHSCVAQLPGPLEVAIPCSNYCR